MVLIGKKRPADPRQQGRVKEEPRSAQFGGKEFKELFLLIYGKTGYSYGGLVLATRSRGPAPA